ncbi:MAG: M20/M25/M40 family metallo-hydrolase [Planctomycetota bacterium]
MFGRWRPSSVAILSIGALGVLLVGVAGVAAQDPPAPAPTVVVERIRHDLDVTLEPASHRVAGVDHMLIPEPLLAGKDELKLVLHAGFELLAGPGVAVAPSGAPTVGPGGAPVQEYRLARVAPAWPRPIVLRYSGTIDHPLVEEREEYARSFARTPGIIDTPGVVLSRASGWFPDLVDLGDGLVTFSVQATAPVAWHVISQGQRVRDDASETQRVTKWVCDQPMDDVYLVGGPLTEYGRAVGAVRAQAFLRTPDPQLAQQFLEATGQYLGMYGKLIGAYPYEKFALVENFWETGYGMPSFTLLGPQIIRFPFILHSSYPHEILHNWWGNSVYVDYEKGNWCEGLTAYLADHLIKEGQGAGESYRRDTLKSYRDYVRTGNEIALADFRERHSSASQAVGYGKSLMVWHMLRRKLGDARFVDGLRAFYSTYRFRRASFDDIANVFSEAGGQDVRPFFAQWVGRTGAPEIAMTDILASGSLTAGYQITVDLAQRQTEEPFRVDVPFALMLRGDTEARFYSFDMTEREQKFTIRVDRPPLFAQVDPQFDVFRRLHRSEVPPTAGELFGAPRVTLVLPTDEGAVAPGAWQSLVTSWAGSEGVQVTRDSAIEAVPTDHPVWLLGTQNRWRSYAEERLGPLGVVIDRGTLRVGPQAMALAEHSFCFVARPSPESDQVVGWIGAANEAAVSGLARKLPHYGRYSCLVFQGTEPTNVLKEQWPVTNSPLVHDFRIGGELDVAIAFPKRTPLATPEPVFDGARLLEHVTFLAAPEREGRGVGSPGHTQAGDYIARAFEAAGLAPGGDGESYFQVWSEPGGPAGAAVSLRNVIGVLPGKRTDWASQSVVLGAHYDHLGRGWPDVREGNAGSVHPGADDNASGVAVLIEVARALASQAAPDRTIVFVAFDGEEWGLKGSRHYVAQAGARPATAARAMINLDTVGRLGAQKLLVLGTNTATEWPHIVRGVGFTTGVGADAVATDPGGSDQVSFHEVGVPAVQIFTGAHADYHKPTDTVDKVDRDGLTQVAVFVREAATYLAGREAPLTTNLTGGAPQPAVGSTGEARRVSLGTVPDMAFNGKGVRLASVTPGSPAAQAGLADGDVIVAIDGVTLLDLKAYSEALKARKVGDTIRIRALRAGRTVDLIATLEAR